MAEMPRKCQKPGVAPVLALDDCDSRRAEEISVRFTMAISACRIVKVTKLVHAPVYLGTV